jgi:hypothetical protein
MPDKELPQKMDLKNAILASYSFLVSQGLKEAYYDDTYGYLGEGFCLGLQDDGVRIMFVKETEAPHIEVLVGTLSAPFEDPYARGRTRGTKGWFSLNGLMEFLTGERVYSKDEFEALDILELQARMSNRLRPLILVILDAFSSEEKVQEWVNRYFKFVEQKDRVSH